MNWLNGRTGRSSLYHLIDTYKENGSRNQARFLISTNGERSDGSAAIDPTAKQHAPILKQRNFRIEGSGLNYMGDIDITH